MQKSLISILVSCAVSAAFGSLTVHEPFNYPVDANIGAVAATGTGLAGNWQRSFTDPASAILRVYEYSDWALPAGYGFTPANVRVGTPVDQTNSAAVGLAPGAQINFDTDGVIYYSYLLNYATDNRSRVSFGSAATPDLMRVQGIASGVLRIYAGGDFTAGAALGAGDYLVVGRISTAATGTDEHRIWVYGSADTVALADPGTAGSYASHSGTITGTADMVQFSNVLDTSYGEFRMGTTWESVVIPEPSTYAMAFGLLALVLLLVRSRRVG